MKQLKVSFPMEITNCVILNDNFLWIRGTYSSGTSGVGCYAHGQCFLLSSHNFLVYNINVVLVTIIYLFLVLEGANLELETLAKCSMVSRITSCCWAPSL
jgi:hypothetical protein